ncbi:SDR family NAD(P)-dependent oxidoreductase [Sphingobium sp. SA916]|uniref:SDR family NAD(P)-dependent oxidoreductase n=1 Tax=Sphingobium sp. SA916 TaxID=1851207 RepID=UPI000C9F0318|nr:SDR family NAD(P)-dependent oxidoreductase [Sphingobium sp. SA916]PNP97980.1 hypothetical protein A8G00_21180 [Sphingobium sp. SA916]
MNTDEKLNFEGRVAIVTGGARGMGREHCLNLARGAAKIIVNDIDEGAAREAVGVIRAAGGEAEAVIKDISTWEGASDLIEGTLDAFGRVDIIVSNAAVINMCPMSEMTPENFDRVMRVNAQGPYYLVLAAWPHLIRQNYGRIVLVSSGAATVGQPTLTHYAASKGAVLGMVRSIALEGEPYDIRVNGLIPVAATEMTRQVHSPEKAAEQEEMLPARLVSPVMAWLAHEDCKTTGELWQAGAGRVGREFIASTRGYFNRDLTIEKVRDNEAEIQDQIGYAVPLDSSEMYNWIVKNSIERESDNR